METLKRLLIVLLIPAIISSSLIVCDENGTGPDGTVEENDLLGTWTATLINAALYLTSSMDQTAIDLMEPAEGELTVTGDHVGTLQNMIPISDPNANIYIVTNQSLFQYFLLPATPAYFLVLTEIPDIGSIASFSAVTANGDSLVYNGNFADFNFNPADYSLTADNAMFYNIDSTETVTLNGTITPSTIPLEANDPTEVLDLPLPVQTLGDVDLTFDEDNTFSLTAISPEDTLNAEGTWELIEPDEIMFAFYDSTMAETDTVITEISLDGNTLALDIALDPSLYLDEESEEMYALLESLFGLQAGTLEAIDVEITMSFRRQLLKIANIQKRKMTPIQCFCQTDLLSKIEQTISKWRSQ